LNAKRTDKRIVAIASKRFREKGLSGFGIAELMKEAGLTWADSIGISIRVTN
jgi:AcrR family transcriptional regulator